MFKFLSATAFAAVMFVSSTANATILSSLLSHNGEEDRLSSTSPAGLAKFVNVNGGAGFDDGDVIYGFTVFNAGSRDTPAGGVPQTNFNFPGNAYGVALFAAELTSVGAPTGGFNLKAVTTSGLRLYDLVDAGFQASLTSVQSDAMVLVASGFAGAATAPISYTNVANNGFSNFDSSVLKFDFAAGINNGGFFQFVGQSNPFDPGLIGAQRGGLNVLAQGPDYQIFKPVAANSFAGFTPTVTSAQLGLDITFVALANNVNDDPGSPINADWDFYTRSTSARLNVVPEPASVIGFVGLFGLGLLRVRLRKARA